MERFHTTSVESSTRRVQQAEVRGDRHAQTHLQCQQHPWHRSAPRSRDWSGRVLRCDANVP